MFLYFHQKCSLWWAWDFFFFFSKMFSKNHTNPKQLLYLSFIHTDNVCLLFKEWKGKPSWIAEENQNEKGEVVYNISYSCCSDVFLAERVWHTLHFLFRPLPLNISSSAQLKPAKHILHSIESSLQKHEEYLYFSM